MPPPFLSLQGEWPGQHRDFGSVILPFGCFASRTVRELIVVVLSPQVFNLSWYTQDFNTAEERKADDKNIGKYGGSGGTISILHPCKINASPPYEIKQESELAFGVYWHVTEITMK